DAPTFTKGPDVTVLEDSGTTTLSNWATNISPGPADESSQQVDFIVSNDNNGLFTAAGQPAIAPDGTLTFTLKPDAFGTTTVTVKIHDAGGTANGVVDTSAAPTFPITATSVYDAPTFTKGPDETVLEDSGPATFSNWATNVSAGPSDESGQTLN